jgi:hypothetical protein
MVRKIMIALLLFGGALEAKVTNTTIYETNCLVCHKQLSFDLGTIFFRYLLKYSDEVSVKSALVDFLEHPNGDTSVMTKEYIKSFGLKQKSELSKKELQEAIDIYWDKYKVFGKLR